jgi:hypothetical protein
MNLLRTATFTIGFEAASDDELEAGAAAFTATLHRAGLTPRDAIDAWLAMDSWMSAGLDPRAHPGLAWERTMAVARAALAQTLAAVGPLGERRQMVIQAC